MSVTATAVAGGLGVLSGVAKSIFGGSQVKKANRELARLKTPFYKIQDEYYQNKNMAAQAAQGGLAQSAKDYYTTESQRGLGAGLNALTTGGGSPNDVSRLFDTYNRSISRVAAEDSAKRLENIRYFMDAQKDLAGQKTTQLTINEYQPYQNKLKELTQRKAAGQQNIYAGIDQAIGSAAATATSLTNYDLMKDSLNPQIVKGMTQPQITPIASPAPYSTQGAMQNIPTFPMQSRFNQGQLDYNAWYNGLPIDEQNQMSMGYYGK